MAAPNTPSTAALCERTRAVLERGRQDVTPTTHRWDDRMLAEFADDCEPTPTEEEEADDEDDLPSDMDEDR